MKRRNQSQIILRCAVSLKDYWIVFPAGAFFGNTTVMKRFACHIKSQGVRAVVRDGRYALARCVGCVYLWMCFVFFFLCDE